MKVIISPFVENILTETAFHELDVVPITDSRLDVNRILATLSPEEARRMKRKFRKLWKRAAKKLSARGKESQAQYIRGAAGKSPTRTIRTFRKQAVKRLVFEEKVLGKLRALNEGNT